MLSKYLPVVISGAATIAMMTVATGQIIRAESADQTRTFVLKAGSTHTIQDGGISYYNAMTDEDYRAPPDTVSLSHDGLTFPST